MVIDSRRVISAEDYSTCDFEIERLEITAEEAGVFGRLTSNVRLQHLCLHGALTDEEARMMLKLLNEINNSIYHVGNPAKDASHE